MIETDNLILVTHQQQFNQPYQSQKDLKMQNAIFDYPHQPIDKFSDFSNDFDEFRCSQLNNELKQRITSPINREGLLSKTSEEKIIFRKNVSKPQMTQISSQIRPFLYLIDQDVNLFTNPKYIFMPDSKITQFVKLLFFIFHTIQIFNLPLQVYLNDLNNLFYYPIFIIIEIGSKLVTGIIVEGQQFVNFRSILKQYKNKDLAGDIILLTTYVLLMIIIHIQLQIILLICCFLLIQNKRIAYQHHFQLIYGIYDKFIIFLTHILNYFMIINLLGCLLLQSVKEIDIFQSTTLYEQYFKSIYSVIEMNAHITPESSYSAISIAVINIIYIFLNAYILIEFYQYLKIDKSLTKLHQYFQETQPEISIKLKLLSEVDKLNQLQFYKDQTLKLNEYKEKRSVLCQYFRNLSSKTINQLVVKSSIENYHQNQTIIQENEADDSSIYFVLEGHVKIFSKIYMLNNIFSNKYTELNKLNKSNHFGELSFYTNQLRTATVVSQVYCRLLKLSRSDFLMEANFQEKQSFYQISDQILQKLKMPNQCFCCKSQDHYIHSCPKLIYHPGPLQILQKDDQNISIIISQEANKQFRRHRKLKRRIPYKDLGKLDVNIYKQMMIDNQSVSSSNCSEANLPYENETYKYSIISNSDKVSISPKKSESNRKIGIDLELSNSLGSKNLQTIFEGVEDEDSPGYVKQQQYKVFVTKSQEGPILHLNSIDYEYSNDRMRSKSQQQIDLEKIGQFDEIRSEFRDFESQIVDLQDFDRMELFSHYFPNYNYTNTITKANLYQNKSYQE